MRQSPPGDLIWVHQSFPNDNNGTKLADAILETAWRMKQAKVTGPIVILRTVDLLPVVSALTSLVLAQESMEETDPNSCLAFTLSSVAVNESVSRMLPEKRLDIMPNQNKKDSSDQGASRDEKDRLLIDFSVYRAPSSGLTKGLEKHLDLAESTPHVFYPQRFFASNCEKSLRTHGYARFEIRAVDLKKARNDRDKGIMVEQALEGLLLVSQRLQDRLGKPMLAVIPDSSIRLQDGQAGLKVDRFKILHLVPCSDESSSPPLAGHDRLLLHEPRSALIGWHKEQCGQLDACLEAALQVQPWVGFPQAPVETWEEESDKRIEILAEAAETITSISPEQTKADEEASSPQLSDGPASVDQSESQADGYTASPLRRYIIAAENCQVKSAASAIVRELLDNGQCLILAEAGMDIGSALKVISEARSKILISSQGGLSSELLFKVRCYPDLEDSPFFESFPALFALAFHLVRVPADAVNNHLMVIASDPTSDIIQGSDDIDNLIDVSASNYLKVNAVKEEEEGEEEEDGAMPSDENDSYSRGSFTRASSLAAAADRDRPLHLQQRLAQRALMELATHSTVHLATVSSSSRIAAVRTAAIMTDALCCGSPPQADEGNAESSSREGEKGGGDTSLSSSLAALRGLEALVLMRDIDRLQPDGFRVPVTTFTVMIGAGLDPGLAREQSRRLRGEVSGPKEEVWGAAPLEGRREDEDEDEIVELCLIDSRNLF